MNYLSNFVVLIIFIITIFISCNPQGKENDKIIKEWLLDKYIPTMNEGDLEGLKTFYTEDLIWFPPNEKIIKGREACIDYLRDSDKIYETQTTLKIEEIKMDNNLAFAWVYYTNIFSPKAGGNPIKDEGKLIYVFEKRSGSSWKISRVIWNNDIPPSE